MIAAIADDLTGATEMAGLGWRHGLTAEVLERGESPGNADLVVYNSDSRNCPASEARRRVMLIARRLRRLRPDWVFKKTDSVLRGNVMAEVESLLKVLELPRCILASANPAAGRVIRDGRYFIHGIPIDRTDFRNDPHHPRRSARVIELLGKAGRIPVLLRSSGTALPAEGIILGQAATADDVRHWARVTDARTLPAGGADYFRALLRARGFKLCGSRGKVRAHAPSRTLFVTGSLAASSARFLVESRAKRWPVFLMPGELIRPGRAVASSRLEWARQIAEALQKHPKVVAGIGCPLLAVARTPLRLGRILTETIARVLSLARLDCICVEGGATAALLLQRMGWKRLSMDQEFATGVVGLRASAARKMLLVFKPGSYTWPPILKRRVFPTIVRRHSGRSA